MLANRPNLKHLVISDPRFESEYVKIDYAKHCPSLTFVEIKCECTCPKRLNWFLRHLDDTGREKLGSVKINRVSFNPKDQKAKLSIKCIKAIELENSSRLHADGWFINQLKELEHLFISGMTRNELQLVTELLDKHAPSLRTIELDSNQFWSAFEKKLKLCSNLTKLRIGLDGELKHHIYFRNFAGWNNLQELKLYKVFIGDLLDNIDLSSITSFALVDCFGVKNRYLRGILHKLPKLENLLLRAGYPYYHISKESKYLIFIYSSKLIHFLD